MKIEKESDNPILETHIYEVEYPDGPKSSLHANTIVEIKFPKLMVRATYTYYLRRLLITEITDQRSSSNMISSQHEMVTSTGRRQ